jgi:hypothetical protein
MISPPCTCLAPTDLRVADHQFGVSVVDPENIAKLRLHRLDGDIGRAGGGPPPQAASKSVEKSVFNRRRSCYA